MKDQFVEKRDVTLSNLIEIPEKWMASDEEVHQARLAKAEKVAKYKKRFKKQN